MPTKTDPTPVAHDFYRELSKQGFTHNQVLNLATRLLDHVRDDLVRNREPIVAK